MREGNAHRHVNKDSKFEPLYCHWRVAKNICRHSFFCADSKQTCTHCGARPQAAAVPPAVPPADPNGEAAAFSAALEEARLAAEAALEALPRAVPRPCPDP